VKKTELRAKYKALRANLSTKEREDSSLKIANLVLKLPIWDCSFFHVFLTIKSLNEVETEPILSILSGKDKHIVLSKKNG
jgi:5-formyltetrahydrofolate cyclo-ligase